MYDKPRKFEGKLTPYPHEEFGVEVRCIILSLLPVNNNSFLPYLTFNCSVIFKYE